VTATEARPDATGDTALGSSLVGSRVQRREDDRLLRGDGRYLADLTKGALAAALVRSPHAHARVLEVDVTDALDV
jgi:carbon-monoxide dehydrogenase large subunit